MISVGLLWRQPFLLTGILLSTGIAVLALLRTRQVITCYLIGFVLGPAAEYFAVAFGAWAYSIPMDGTILPLWLPFGWGIAAVTLWSVLVELAVQEATADLTHQHRDFRGGEAARPATPSQFYLPWNRRS